MDHLFQYSQQSQSDNIYHQGMVIIDYGSQYTLVIARKLRSLGVYCQIIAPCEDAPDLKFTIKGIVLSGGPDSITHQKSRSLCKWVFDLAVPILGICYGMQLILDYFGGNIRTGQSREYGKANLQLIDYNLMSDHGKKLYHGIDQSHRVWMSHGDDLDFTSKASIALSKQGRSQVFYVLGRTHRAIASLINQQGNIVCLQYHPEVKHSEFGDKLLSNFAKQICKIDHGYDKGSILENSLKYIRNKVKDQKVCVACSGGVDSTVSFVLLTKALGKDQVKGAFVDNGLLRLDDLDAISKLSDYMGLDIEIIDAKQIFYHNLRKVIDPENKRQIIGKTFIEVFSEFCQKNFDQYRFLCQGTLYSDVIESGHGGVKPQTIKSHHNVGGLPSSMPFELLEPLRYLFKDEVRALGEELNIPQEFLYRHPFPGPGLGVRIAGEVNQDQVKILQQADKIFIDQLRAQGFYNKVWQAFAVLLPVKSVGVMGDQRTYDQVVSIRAVLASDAMTAEVADLPMSFLTSVAENIVSNVKGINRVLYDITTKPPATIEWQ